MLVVEWLYCLCYLWLMVLHWVYCVCLTLPSSSTSCITMIFVWKKKQALICNLQGYHRRVRSQHNQILMLCFGSAKYRYVWLLCGFFLCLLPENYKTKLAAHPLRFVRFAYQKLPRQHTFCLQSIHSCVHACGLKFRLVDVKKQCDSLFQIKIFVRSLFPKPSEFGCNYIQSSTNVKITMWQSKKPYNFINLTVVCSWCMSNLTITLIANIPTLQPENVHSNYNFAISLTVNLLNLNFEFYYIS